MKKLFFALIFVISFCSLSNAEDTITPGKWNIYGQGFIEKDFVRLKLGLEGEMNLDIKNVEDVEDEVMALTDGNEIIFRQLVSNDMKALTSYDIKLELTLTGAEISAWSEHLPNTLKIPVLLPEKIPTEEYPFELPTITKDKLSYTLKFTSSSSGVLRVEGYIDVDTVGECEVKTDCTVWNSAVEKMPALSSDTSSGCNSGMEFFVLALIFFGISYRK